MNPIKIYVTSMLAVAGLAFFASYSNAQTIPNAVGDPAAGASSLTEAVGSQGAAGIFSASTASPAAATSAPSTGLFGIGQPRTFPVLRYLAQKRAQRKAKIRSSSLGKIFKGLLKPVSKLTGGVIPAEPIPNHVEVATPGPQGSAARIKIDQINAPKRLAALQELGKVDCNWYPEALSQITLALRHDRSACVRLEAARLLAACDCCTPQMMFALKTCVQGTSQDGNPKERSEEIRAQAAIALERCLACSDSAINESAPLHRPEYPSAPSRIPLEAAPGLSSSIQGQQSSGETNSIARVGFNQTAPQLEAVPAKVKGEAAIKIPSFQDVVTDSRQVLKEFREQQNARKRRVPNSIRDAWRESK